MKAAVHETYGGPEVIVIKELPKPVPEPNQILVKVIAATVNRTDCGFLRGEPSIVRLFAGLRKPRKTISGSDFAGVVLEVGDKVHGFKPGDKVFGFDDNGVCSHAGYLVIEQDKPLTQIPEGISFIDAVASLEGAHYAFNFINKLNLKSGDKVLLNGATGAIGSAGLQLLNYFGAEVTAICDTKNMKLIEDLGAHSVIDYTKEDFTSGKIKYDYVFDSVGKSSFGACKKILKSGGIYVSSELGKNMENIYLALFTPIFAKKKVIFPLPSNIKRSINFMTKLLDEKKFKPVIDRVYNLEDIVEAFLYVESGKKTGNVIINME